MMMSGKLDATLLYLTYPNLVDRSRIGFEGNPNVRYLFQDFTAEGQRYMQSWNWKGIEVTNAHERKPAVYVGALRAAFDALRARPVDLPALHTHHWSLDQVTDAFRTADERPPEFVKSVIHP